MRLTLRTLLAYLDDILEPADRQDLQQQIDASDFAADLVYRTRDATRRLRLGSPEPLGTGPIDDPNSMAEYLDNALPEESLAEFERSCLESDAMLAEAAACHHVLAMVLEQPVQIDPDTRKRMHDLADMLDELQQVRDMEAKLVASESPPGETPREAKPRLPAVDTEEDLDADAGSTSLVTWSMVVLAVVLLGLAFALTQDGAQPQVAQEDATAEAQASGQEVADGEQDQEQSEGDMPGPDLIDPEPLGTDEPAATVVEPVDGVAPQESDEAASGASELSSPESDADSLPSGDQPAVEPDMGSDAPKVVPGATEEQPMADEPAEMGEESTVTNEADNPEATTEAQEDEEEVRAPTTILKADDALLMFEREPEVWSRASTGEEADAGSRLLSLPTYRSVVQLQEGLRFELVGLARVHLGSSSTDEDLPRIELRHGRLVIQNVSADSMRELELAVGGAVGRVTIDPGAYLAISAMRVFSPGTDLINRSPPMQTIAYTPMGGVEWAANGDSYGFGGSKKWRVSQQGDLIEVTAYQGDSGWIEGLRLSAWDDQASPLLVRSILPGQPAWPQLMEIIESDPLKEVRALATRCSAAVGHPDPLVASLDDESQRPIWRSNFQELRDLASRGTIEASRVRQAMIEMNGERNGEDLFRMLRGFDRGQVGLTEAEVQTGAMLQLIEWLESESLPIRVMATLNLEEITGRSEIFEPTESPRGRQRVVRRLQRQLRDNELTPAGA